MLKICSIWMSMFCALFVAAAALPAAADEPAYGEAQNREEEEFRQYFTDNMTRGVVKGMGFVGKQATPEQQMKIREIIYTAFPEILARLRQAGLYDEYKEQLSDPDIRRLDDQAMDARTMQEVLALNKRQMEITRTKRPRLYKFMNSDPELGGIVMRMMQKIAAVCK